MAQTVNSSSLQGTGSLNTDPYTAGNTYQFTMVSQASLSGSTSGYFTYETVPLKNTILPTSQSLTYYTSSRKYAEGNFTFVPNSQDLTGSLIQDEHKWSIYIPETNNSRRWTFTPTYDVPVSSIRYRGTGLLSNIIIEEL